MSLKKLKYIFGLSVKVLDSPCRLRDTLIHELCHAATWMIDQCRGGNKLGEHAPTYKI